MAKEKAPTEEQVKKKPEDEDMNSGPFAKY